MHVWIDQTCEQGAAIEIELFGIGPTRLASSAVEPTATIRPSRTATDSVLGR
ncbi:MAG: hypothetical protein ABIQ39_05465 [Ilumatobacteraceae bacterium]